MAATATTLRPVGRIRRPLDLSFSAATPTPSGALVAKVAETSAASQASAVSLAKARPLPGPSILRPETSAAISGVSTASQVIATLEGPSHGATFGLSISPIQAIVGLLSTSCA